MRASPAIFTAVFVLATTSYLLAFGHRQGEARFFLLGYVPILALYLYGSSKPYPVLQLASSGTLVWATALDKAWLVGGPNVVLGVVISTLLAISPAVLLRRKKRRVDVSSK